MPPSALSTATPPGPRSRFSHRYFSPPLLNKPLCNPKSWPVRPVSSKAKGELCPHEHGWERRAKSQSADCAQKRKRCTIRQNWVRIAKQTVGPQALSLSEAFSASTRLETAQKSNPRIAHKNENGAQSTRSVSIGFVSQNRLQPLTSEFQSPSASRILSSSASAERSFSRPAARFARISDRRSRVRMSRSKA